MSPNGNMEEAGTSASSTASTGQLRARSNYSTSSSASTTFLSTAPTTPAFDDSSNSHNVTIRVKCKAGDANDAIAALGHKIDLVLSALNALKGDNMVAVAALSSNMLCLEKQTELLTSMRERQAAEMDGFDTKMTTIIQRVVESEFGRQKQDLDRVIHEKLDSFGVALLKEQRKTISDKMKGAEEFGNLENLETLENTENLDKIEISKSSISESPVPPILSQIMHSVQSVASQTQILRGEVIMEMKSYQQQLVELVQNNLIFFLEQLESGGEAGQETHMGHVSHLSHSTQPMTQMGHRTTPSQSHFSDVSSETDYGTFDVATAASMTPRGTPVGSPRSTATPVTVKGRKNRERQPPPLSYLPTFSNSHSPRFEDPVSPTSPTSQASRRHHPNIRHSPSSLLPSNFGSGPLTSTTLYSNPRSAPIPTPALTLVGASDVSMHDSSGQLHLAASSAVDVSMNDFLTFSSSLKDYSMGEEVLNADAVDPSEISEMEMFVRNITTRRGRDGLGNVADEDHKFFTKVSRLFKKRERDQLC